MIVRNVALRISMFFVALVISAEVVERVDITGLKVLDHSVVAPYIDIHVGQDVDDHEIRQQIKSLYASGYFEQVSVVLSKGSLVISLTEQPVIHSIVVEAEGLPEGGIADGLKDAGLEAGELLNEVTLAKFVAGLKASLESSGFKRVVVELSTDRYTEDSVDIVLSINVVTKVKLKSVKFEGDQVYTDHKLNAQLRSRTTSALSFLFDDDLVSDIQLEQDRRALVNWFQSQGYFNAEVQMRKTPVMPKQRIWKNEYVEVTYAIQPGVRYTVAGVEVRDPFHVLSEDKVTHAKATLEGSYFVKGKTLKMQDQLMGNVDVPQRRFVMTSDVQFVSADEVNIVMQVQEVTSRVRFIHFTGNYNTKEQTLRKTVSLKESELFLESDLIDARRSLMGRPYIKGASYQVKQVDDEVFDVYFDVEESQKSFDFGGNGGMENGDFSKLNATIFLNDQNVLGSGDAFSANVSLSKVSQQARISYSQPNYSGTGAGRSFSANISRLSKDGEQSTNYSFDEFGLSARWSVPLSKLVTSSAQLSYSRMNFFNVDKASSLVQDYFQNRAHELDLLSLNSSIRYANIDSAYFPTRGVVVSGSAGSTLPVSDAAKFYTLETSVIGYYPLTEILDQTVVFRTRALFSYAAAYDGDSLPFFARKYAGGVGTARGYETGMLGPKYEDGIYNEEADGTRVLIAKRTKAKGGGILLVGNAEIQMPSPVPDIVTPYLFVDVANVFEEASDIDLTKLRGSAGLMLSAKLPVIDSKVSVSIAAPFNADDETFNMVSFGFGTMF